MSKPWKKETETKPLIRNMIKHQLNGNEYTAEQMIEELGLDRSVYAVQIQMDRILNARECKTFKSEQQNKRWLKRVNDRRLILDECNIHQEGETVILLAHQVQTLTGAQRLQRRTNNKKAKPDTLQVFSSNLQLKYANTVDDYNKFSGRVPIKQSAWNRYEGGYPNGGPKRYREFKALIKAQI